MKANGRPACWANGLRLNSSSTSVRMELTVAVSTFCHIKLMPAAVTATTIAGSVAASWPCGRLLSIASNPHARPGRPAGVVAFAVSYEEKKNRDTLFSSSPTDMSAVNGSLTRWGSTPGCDGGSGVYSRLKGASIRYSEIPRNPIRHPELLSVLAADLPVCKGREM